ncbi:hypothetical protein D3C80_1806230 [compost metagenome]
MGVANLLTHHPHRFKQIELGDHTPQLIELFAVENQLSQPAVLFVIAGWSNGISRLGLRH